MLKNVLPGGDLLSRTMFYRGADLLSRTKCASADSNQDIIIRFTAFRVKDLIEQAVGFGPVGLQRSRFHSLDGADAVLSVRRMSSCLP